MNVEEGKKGFQETTRAEANHVGLEDSAVGEADDSPPVAMLIGTRLDEADGFYARGDYVEFGDEGASYGVKVGTHFYQRLLGPSDTDEWDSETCAVIDAAIASEYGCEINTDGDGYYINAEFFVEYNEDTDETLQTLGNRVENETSMLTLMNESQYGQEAVHRVAKSLGWTYEKSPTNDPDGYAYFKYVERDGLTVRVRPDEH